MVRYFMTIPEAVRLVLQAASMGQGGEVFVLDMGWPVETLHLVKELILLSEFDPHVEISIVFTSIREGGKLFEELMTDEDGVLSTKDERIMVAKNDPVLPEVVHELLKRFREIMTVGMTTIRSATWSGKQQTAPYWN